MIKFANKFLPDYVKVTDIKYSILPSIDHKTEKVFGRAGVYDFGIELGQKEFEVSVNIEGVNQYDVVKKAREFSSYLFYEDLQPFILLDEPDKQYMARVIGDSQISELYRIGQATLKFVSPSPYAESLTEKIINMSPKDYTPIQVINNGTVDTQPIIDLTLKQSSTSIAVISDDKFIQIGSDVGPDKTTIVKDPIVLNESFASYSGWSSGTNVDGGIVTGTFTSNGTYISQTGNDFGTHTGWHGAGGIKTLPAPITDFKVRAGVVFNPSHINQVGRVEIYLLDANNVHLGKVALVDNYSNGHFAKLEARAGSLNDRNYFSNHYGSKKGMYGVFSGVIEIQRQGKSWKSYIAKVDGKGVHSQSMTKTWYDTKNKYSSGKLAKIQVHIGAYSTQIPVSTMRLTDLKVYQLSSGIDLEKQTPVIFSAGDTVTIDNQRAIVLRNGEPIFSELDPSSDFFSIQRGSNGIVISPPIADVQIRYREKWL